MTGLHSVCPNAVDTSACGKASIIVRSSVVEAGAAPQEMRRRQDRSRSAMPGTATTAAHMAGTRKMLLTRSRSIMSSVATGSKPPDRMITCTPPSSSGGSPPASPAMWNIGAPGTPTFSVADVDAERGRSG